MPTQSDTEFRREQIKRELAEARKRHAANLLKEQAYINSNLLEFFTPFDGEVDPHKTLPVPKQHPKQVELFEAFKDRTKKVFTYTGGNRTGKTVSGVDITWCYVTGTWLWSGEKIWFPHRRPRRIRIVGQDWEKHIKTVVIPALWQWMPRNHVSLKGGKPKKNSLGVEAFWEDERTGSTIEIMSNRQETSLFEGWDGDLIYYDEPPSRNNRTACTRGLVDRQGKELFCMTLLKEPWVDREVIQAELDNGMPDPSVFNVHATMYDNVGYGITIDGVRDFKSKLTKEERDARIDGIPSYMSGLVCKHFRKKTKASGGHIVERFDIPSDWPVDIMIDIHPRKEQAVLFTAVSPQQIKYCCFEIWEHGSGEQIADQIMRIVSRNNLRVNRIGCDPLAKGDSNANAGDTTFSKMANVFARFGHELETASKDKVSGIIEINNHLKGPNNEPSLFFFSDLKRTVHNVSGWMYDDDTQKPSKEADDQCENLYRTLLWDTEYTLPEYEELDEYQEYEVDGTTGY